MTQNARFYLKAFLIFIVALALFGYSWYQSHNLISGAEIFISSPQNNATVSSPLLLITGVAKNVTHFTLDDNPIFTDKNGNFSEKTLLAPGLNEIKLSAEDKFQRKTQKILEIVCDCEPKSATSTANLKATSTKSSLIQ